MTINKTKTERLTDVAQLILNVFDYPSVPQHLRSKLYDLYIEIWATIIPKPDNKINMG